MSKYQRLTDYLKSLDTTEWTASFRGIEDILGTPLPKSAYQHQAWWANQAGGGHTQSASWQDAGWKTSNLDMDLERVTFVRQYENVFAQNAKLAANPSVSTQNVFAPQSNKKSNGRTELRLTIAQAKEGLAATFGVPIEAIEITIRA